jgi:hypothetical protein
LSQQDHDHPCPAAFSGGNADFLKEEEKGLVGREEQKRAKFKRHCRQ